MEASADGKAKRRKKKEKKSIRHTNHFPSFPPQHTAQGFPRRSSFCPSLITAG